MDESLIGQECKEWVKRRVIENEIQLKSAINHSITAGNDNKYTLSYFKSFVSLLSAQNMFDESKNIIENLVENGTINRDNDKDNNPAYVLIAANKELGGDKDVPVVKFNQYKITQKVWEEGCENSNSSQIFVTNWGSQNCKLVVYNIPNNNIIPMAHHIRQIEGLARNGCRLVVNFDSEIEDDSVVEYLQKEQKIDAMFGVHHKKKNDIGVMRKIVECCVSIGKSKVFQYGAAIIGIILFCLKVYRWGLYQEAVRNRYAGKTYTFWSI